MMCIPLHNGRDRFQELLLDQFPSLQSVDVLYISESLPDPWNMKEGLRLKEWVINEDYPTAVAAFRDVEMFRASASFWDCELPIVRPVVLDWSTKGFDA